MIPAFIDPHGHFPDSGFLALHRAGKDIWRANEDIHDVILMPGDVLLVQGAEDQIGKLKSDDSFLVLDANVAVPRTSKAPVALAITAALLFYAASPALRRLDAEVHAEIAKG